ncbi:probable receptor-like protein kinase At5g24010 [Salvia miltiorrhiza]|uniref:probable receptor-like protein kinase At5g24010 n=1 Tax=Salvia miltiorrhiza TaxID=226208 RepID=UPI0025ACCE52|nr:probable receptor-like protein kinase At5g24010 [Salvia miltiorrhiza]
MEFLRSQKKILCISFLLHFSSLFFPSASYTLPDYYFINCGSTSTLRTYRRNFTGDQNSGNNVLFSRDGSSSASDQTLPADQLYQTARIFTKSSFYELDLDQDATYVLRLHFFPFPSLGNLANARFHVSASKFSLLSNFNVQNGGAFPLVEEFLMRIAAGKLKIQFKPDGEERSFAFVNAIEVFLAPPELVQDAALPRVTRQGSGENYNGVLDFPLRVVHRINVGGGNVTRETDTLLRYWVPDDVYLLFPNTAKNKIYSDEIKYPSGGATRFNAPDSVYNTAKEMNINGRSTSNNFNISWRFEVRKGVPHLVRLHFCDIVSQTTNEFFRFNLYIYGRFSSEVYPWGFISQLAAPFYIDFVVDSDDSGFMNVSVGPNSQSQFKTAILNGVEIMEVLGDKAPDSGDGDASRKRVFIVVGSCLGGLVLVALVFACVFLRLKKRKLKTVEALDWRLVRFQGGSSDSRTTVRTSVTGSPFADLNLGLRIPLSGILFATKQFDPKLMIGQGGFGKVYKGTLRNGTKVAIKRSEAGHGQGLAEFHTEIKVLSKIRHQHLVSLIGYCDERDEMILVYEFMENGTLREHLYGGDETACQFSWDERLQICSDAAKGIHYLHTGSSGTIIHRDIKSTNILLDDKYVAKVADFGLSRSGHRDQTHVSTEVKGSFGYLDPEYFRCLQLTQKSDVYSFGVVLLEVLCARLAVDPGLPREQVNLADWGLLWQRKGQLENIVDPCLVGKINPNSLRKFGETVEKCLQECGADRPNMVDVLWDLEYCRKLQHSTVPQQPYEDTTTEVSWGLPMPALQRLPSQSLSVDEDDSIHGSFTVAGSSQLNASEVFSQLSMDEAR